MRIPRTSMLARLASVSREGVYARNAAAKPQLAYGALILGRASMVRVRRCAAAGGGRVSGGAPFSPSAGRGESKSFSEHLTPPSVTSASLISPPSPLKDSACTLQLALTIAGQCQVEYQSLSTIYPPHTHTLSLSHTHTP